MPTAPPARPRSSRGPRVAGRPGSSRATLRQTLTPQGGATSAAGLFAEVFGGSGGGGHAAGRTGGGGGGGKGRVQLAPPQPPPPQPQPPQQPEYRQQKPTAAQKAAAAKDEGKIDNMLQYLRTYAPPEKTLSAGEIVPISDGARAPLEFEPTVASIISGRVLGQHSATSERASSLRRMLLAEGIPVSIGAFPPAEAFDDAEYEAHDTTELWTAQGGGAVPAQYLLVDRPEFQVRLPGALPFESSSRPRKCSRQLQTQRGEDAGGRDRAGMS